MSAASIALEVAEVEGQLVSAQTIRHTLQQVGLHGPIKQLINKLKVSISIAVTLMNVNEKKQEKQQLLNDKFKTICLGRPSLSQVVAGGYFIY